MLKQVTLQCGCIVELFITSEGEITDGRLIKCCYYHKEG